MKKVIIITEDKRMLVTLNLKNVHAISAIDAKDGIYPLLEMQGFLYLNGKLIRIGNLSDCLPENEQGFLLKELWKHNVSYVYGTLKQMNCIGDISLEQLIRDSNALKNAFKTLESNNLVVDRGITFGEKRLVIPLEKEVIAQYQMIA